MLHTKYDVKVNGLKPETLFAIVVVYSMYQAITTNLRITSITEGKHSSQSLHYVGYAVDFGLEDITTHELRVQFRDNVNDALTNEYDVVLEEPEGAIPHLHVEFQPKRY